MSVFNPQEPTQPEWMAGVTQKAQDFKYVLINRLDGKGLCLYKIRQQFGIDISATLILSHVKTAFLREVINQWRVFCHTNPDFTLHGCKTFNDICFILGCHASEEDMKCFTNARFSDRLGKDGDRSFWVYKAMFYASGRYDDGYLKALDDGCKRMIEIPKPIGKLAITCKMGIRENVKNRKVMF